MVIFSHLFRELTFHTASPKVVSVCVGIQGSRTRAAFSFLPHGGCEVAQAAGTHLWSPFPSGRHEAGGSSFLEAVYCPASLPGMNLIQQTRKTDALAWQRPQGELGRDSPAAHV